MFNPFDLDKHKNQLASKEYRAFNEIVADLLYDEICMEDQQSIVIGYVHYRGRLHIGSTNDLLEPIFDEIKIRDLTVYIVPDWVYEESNYEPFYVLNNIGCPDLINEWLFTEEAQRFAIKGHHIEFKSNLEFIPNCYKKENWSYYENKYSQ